MKRRYLVMIDAHWAELDGLLLWLLNSDLLLAAYLCIIG